MKDQQTNLNDSSTKQDLTQQVKQIKCINNNPALLLCSNEECTQFSFLCANQNCKCHEQHPFCYTSGKNSLLKSLKNKLVYYDNIQNKIKQEIQKAIDYLSELEQTLLAQCKQKFNEFIGLNEYQKDFIKSIQQAEVNHIKGKTIWNMALNHKKEKKIIDMVNQLQQEVKQIWNRFQKDLNKLKANIKSTLENFGIRPTIFIDSKVIVDFRQTQLIRGFFESQQQKIKSVKLLFRASQNNFSATSFHSACNGHSQTITICENEYGKKIGGYTPLAWNSNDSYYSDSTYKSFTFSLTNNHKFIPENLSVNHMRCDRDYGPTFGDGYDLTLSNGCNKNNDSYCNVNYRYKNVNYKYDDPESWNLLIGSKQDNNFTVKEYEVWKVQFA